MTIPKNYFRDRLILLLVSINVFLTLLGCGLIALNLSGSASSASYIVQYRANLGLSAPKVGNASTFIEFMLFAVFTLVFNNILSIRVYHIKRHFSIVILSLTLLLLLLVVVVSNVLLFNHS
ncbi:MAG TPA: hypothetical protein VLF39_03460 [Candidatus Saccharimonadales bacterium]|nr:hypothetical protein [Candidatus Saccharimonadales bacterium]